MILFVELHILQNFAPANLNRDETGAPKDCEFGGHRRARISSQCIKRAIRECFREQKLLPEGNLAVRTKLLISELVKRLAGDGRSEEEARTVVETALRGIGLGADDGKTQYLLLLGRAEIQALAGVCAGHWDALRSAAGGNTAAASAPGQKAGRPSARQVKQAGQQAVPDAVRKALEAVLDGGKAADLALFGRMLADRPEKNVDAACQVAHAISTNRVSMEFDFYTAVDDLKPDDTAGAGMLGTVEFNSACFYRYANVDLRQLRRNLDDAELARRTLDAFIQASIEAIPTGKQHSTAAQSPPSFVFVVARQRRLWSLANAFVRPIFPGQHGDLVQSSIAALDAQWGKLARMYGESDVIGKWWASLDDDGITNLKDAKVNGVADVVKGVLAVATFEADGDGRT